MYFIVFYFRYLAVLRFRMYHINLISHERTMPTHLQYKHISFWYLVLCCIVYVSLGMVVFYSFTLFFPLFLLIWFIIWVYFLYSLHLTLLSPHQFRKKGKQAALLQINIVLKYSKALLYFNYIPDKFQEQKL